MAREPVVLVTPECVELCMLVPKVKVMFDRVLLEALVFARVLTLVVLELVLVVCAVALVVSVVKFCLCTGAMKVVFVIPVLEWVLLLVAVIVVCVIVVMVVFWVCVVLMVFAVSVLNEEARVLLILTVLAAAPLCTETSDTLWTALVVAKAAFHSSRCDCRYCCAIV